MDLSTRRAVRQRSASSRGNTARAGFPTALPPHLRGMLVLVTFFFRSHAPTTTGHRSGLFPLFEVPSSVDFVLCDAWKPQLVDGDRWMGAMSKKGLGNSVFFLKGLISADMFGCKRSGMFLELNMCTRCGGILCAFAATLYHWFSSLRHSH